MISIPRILIARKLYTILECLRERDTHVAGVGGNGQKLRESGLKKTLGCASTHTCYPISTPIISAVSFCLWQHISDNFWNSAIKFISNLIQALSRTYVCFQVLSRPWIHMSEIQVLSSTFKKRGNPVYMYIYIYIYIYIYTHTYIHTYIYIYIYILYMPSISVWRVNITSQWRFNCQGVHRGLYNNW